MGQVEGPFAIDAARTGVVVAGGHIDGERTIQFQVGEVHRTIERGVDTVADDDLIDFDIARVGLGVDRGQRGGADIVRSFADRSGDFTSLADRQIRIARQSDAGIRFAAVVGRDGFQNGTIDDFELGVIKGQVRCINGDTRAGTA